jgi:1-acyl-sn-glycerol-3-phosphate acyltransferase/nucleoside-diphosphate-sugar epimerase
MAVDTEVINTSPPRGLRTRRILVIDQRQSASTAIADRLVLRKTGRDGLEVSKWPDVASGDGGFDATDQIVGHDVVVFSPLWPRRGRLVPDVRRAEAVFNSCRDCGVSHVVLISSAEIYGADYCNPGMVRESRTVALKRPNRLASAWGDVESMAHTLLNNRGCCCTVVRPCFVLSGDRREFADRLFRSRFAFPLAGYDPNIQLLGVEDLAEAVAALVEANTAGTYNVAPREVIPLRKALQLAGCRSIPLPYSLQYVIRAALSRVGIAVPVEQIAFLRYPWTVSIDKLRSKVGFEPQCSSEEAILTFRAGPNMSQRAASRGRSLRRFSNIVPKERPSLFDDFGMDEEYIRSCGRWQLGFLERYYWRIEVDGLENIPRVGGGVLAGVHRGFMPFDGVMLVHLLSKYVGRVPRFLMHPGLVKFPHVSRFLTRLGGIIACQENADHVLEHGEILGVFPEGIRGAFRMYNRDVYKIGKHRDDYVRSALRYGVPIVPFITVGAAEAFPILAKIEWPWWRRHTHWPFFPITPTGNLIPLPTKWHIRILNPIRTNEYEPGAAHDMSIVRSLSSRVEKEMQFAIDDLLRRRRSIFFGSLLTRKRSELKLLRGASLRDQAVARIAPVQKRDTA